MRKIIVLFMVSLLFTCKESQPEVDDFRADPYKYDALQGNWTLNYIVYKNKKLDVSNICNSNVISALKIEKDTAYLTTACYPLIKYKINKINYSVLKLKYISLVSSDCKSIYLCDKNPKNIDGKIFENYNRQILQNNSNIWIDSDTVTYKVTRYNSKIDSLTFKDKLGNQAMYYKNNVK